MLPFRATCQVGTGFVLLPRSEGPSELREVEVALAQGTTVALAVRGIEVTELTYYRWRREYGGLNVEQARRLTELEKENLRLRRAVSDLKLDKLILKEAAEGNF